MIFCKVSNITSENILISYLLNFKSLEPLILTTFLIIYEILIIYP